MRRYPLVRILALFVLPSFSSHVFAQESPPVVETKHYRILFEGEATEAEEAGRLLEAAWKEYEKYFKAKPKLRKGARLDVRVLKDRGGWEAALRADGIKPPAAGGYYHPANQTAYLFRQPTRYYSRVLLLHEAAHQFHYLAKTRNQRPHADWYTEGVAEFVSWHTWDGSTLRLGVIPPISLKDYAGVALREVKAEGFDLEAVVEGKAPASRAISWALLAYLATGNKGKPQSKFDAFRRKMDGGVKPTPLFWRFFGRPPDLTKRFGDWLFDHQQPWIQLFNEWEGTGPGRMRGFAKVVSACYLQRPAHLLKATIEVPKERVRWRAGPLLHFTSRDDYSVALVDWAGYLRIMRRVGNRWQTIEQGPGPGPSEDGLYHFEVFRKGSQVYLMFKGGQSYGPWELPGSQLGLALENCEISFRNLEWK